MTSLAVVTTVAGSMLVLAPLTAAAEPRQAVATAPITQVADDPLPETEEELRAAIQAILDDPAVGVGVRREALEALEIGTVEAMTYFLETGWQFGQDEDNRFAIFVIIGTPGISAALRAAAVAALDGTPEDRAYFIETGQYEVE
jgi:hypothetical protein